MSARMRSRYTLAGLALAMLMTAIAAGQEPESRRPARPTPRWPDGTVNFGAPPGQAGVWEGEEPLVTDPLNYETVLGRRPRLGRIHINDIPIQPWARALIEMRNARFLADEPYTRCKPSPGPRSFGTAYGVELLNLPGSNRAYVFMIGGSHSYREIFMDGRLHPSNVQPNYFGHSIGRWEGDTLVIDTIGFNEQAWMDRWGMPHTNRLHTIERITRPDFDTLNYEVTIDDPGAYTAPWTSGYTKRWQAGVEIFEYVCQENNFGPQLMIGVENGEERGNLPFIP
jgi:hypothetical protein